MGFIPNTSRTLTAYLTQAGREYLVSGDREGFTIKFFALSDSDTNYLVSSQPGPDTQFNMLPAGFVPDMSGDDDGAIHSLSGGIKQRYYLSGGSNIRNLGSNLQLGSTRNGARFTSNGASITLNKNTTGYQLLQFDIPLELFGGVPTGYERVKVYPLPPSQGTSPEIYSAVSTDIGNGGVYGWASGAAVTQNVKANIVTYLPAGGYNLVVKFRVVAYKSALSIDPDYSTYTATIALNISQGTGTTAPGTVLQS